MRPVISAELNLVALLLIQCVVKVNLDHLGTGPCQLRDVDRAVGRADPFVKLRIGLIPHVNPHRDGGTVILGQIEIKLNGLIRD